MAGSGLNGGQGQGVRERAVDGKRSVWICLQKLSGRNIQGKRQARPYFQKENFLFLLTLPLRYSLYCKHGTGKEAIQVKNMKEGMIPGTRGRVCYGFLCEPCIPWQ